MTPPPASRPDISSACLFYLFNKQNKLNLLVSLIFLATTRLYITSFSLDTLWKHHVLGVCIAGKNTRLNSYQIYLILPKYWHVSFAWMPAWESNKMMQKSYRVNFDVLWILPPFIHLALVMRIQIIYPLFFIGVVLYLHTHNKKLKFNNDKFFKYFTCCFYLFLLIIKLCIYSLKGSNYISSVKVI